MTLRIGAMALLAGLACATPSYAADSPEKLVTVTGEAMTSAAPDLATIRLGVSAQGKTARQASEANAKVMTTVMAAIKAAGIADRDVQTAQLSLQPQFEQNKNGPPHLTGFQSSNDVTVKVRDIGKLADLIDRAVAAGANEISGIEFSLSDRSKQLDEARAQAIADARRKADIYAKAAGLVAGRAVAITESSASPPPRPAAAFRAVATPVAPGELTLHVTVMVSYELAQ